MKPVTLGEFTRDITGEEEPVEAPPEFHGPHLCANCVHQSVCVVADSVRKLGNTGISVAVGACQTHVPIETP